MFYIIVNFIGVVLCAFLLYVVARNAKRSVSDILTCGLASGCLLMSVFCGMQCLLSMLDGIFYGGVTACKIEAIAHIAAIQTEFACVTALFLNMYFSIVRKKYMSHKFAIILVSVIWIVAVSVTCLLSLVSPIYLMSNGTFCFFAFSSAAIVCWLIPGLLISLGIIIFVHIKTMSYFSKMLPSANSVMMRGKITKFVTLQDIFTQQFRWRSTLFIFALLFGWGSAIVSAVYEFASGETPEELVTSVGVGGVLFSVAAPLIFFCTAQQQHCCFFRKKPHEVNVGEDMPFVA